MEGKNMDKQGKLKLLVALAVVLALVAIVAFAKPQGGGSEQPRLRECRDGIDNDGDGQTDWPNDTGCDNRNDADETDCGDGVCEGGETVESCPADCAPANTTTTIPTTTTMANTTTTILTTTTTTLPPDSCSDTDGGYNIFVAGTASGYQEGTPFSYDEICQSIWHLTEYQCAGPNGTTLLNLTINCVQEGYPGCSEGACISDNSTG